MGRPPKERPPETLRKWPPDEPVKPEDDELATCTERAIITLLNSDIDAKDMNAAIANAIRMLQLKHKIQPAEAERSFWGDGDGN